jgi:hypothetical protein
VAEPDPFAHLDHPAEQVDPFAHLDASTKEPDTSIGGLGAAMSRGAAPYAAGALAGGAIGSIVPGVGTALGAGAGIAAVTGADLATGFYNTVARAAGWPTVGNPTEATERGLDIVGVRRPSTGVEHMVQAATGGAVGAATGAGAAKTIGEKVVDPLIRGVAEKLAARPGAQAASGALGGIGAQGAAELGAGPIGQFAAGTAASLLPFGGHLAAPTRINASENAKRAIEAGFVLPPPEASEGHIGQVNMTNLAAAEAGKIKTGQLASAINQPLVNLYAQKDLWLKPGTTLTPQVFEAVRAREGKVYQEVVDSVPEIELAADPLFKEDVGVIGKRSVETERLFPSTTEPPGVTALRAELLRNSRADTKSVMNYIADLRFQATRNFQTIGNAMAHRFGAAQREAAHALEDAMERSVRDAPKYYAKKLSAATQFRDLVLDERRRQGLPLAGPVVDLANDHVDTWQRLLDQATAKDASNQTLVDRFRDARSVMAKSYDVEAVTNVSTGDVSASGLGRLLQQGRPFTGNLKLIADSANSFHRAFQNPAAFGGVEPLSLLDVAYATTAAATAAATGHVGPAIAAMVPLTRPWWRNRILSPGYQRGMISGTPTPAPLSIFAQPGVFSAVEPY